MPIVRTTAVLGAALVVLMTVVMLRAETTHLNYEVSQLDARAETLLSELHESEIEIARLRNPAMIRGRVAEMRLGPAPSPSAAPAPRTTGPGAPVFSPTPASPPLSLTPAN